MGLFSVYALVHQNKGNSGRGNLQQSRENEIDAQGDTDAHKKSDQNITITIKGGQGGGHQNTGKDKPQRLEQEGIGAENHKGRDDSKVTLARDVYKQIFVRTRKLMIKYQMFKTMRDRIATWGKRVGFNPISVRPMKRVGF